MVKLFKALGEIMTKEEILEKLSQEKETITKKYSVEKIGLFGSYARNQQSETSDIDFYVEFKNKSFRNLTGLWNFLENLYNKKIDIIHKHKNNNQVILKNIQKEVIYG